MSIRSPCIAPQSGHCSGITLVLLKTTHTNYRVNHDNNRDNNRDPNVSFLLQLTLHCILIVHNVVDGRVIPVPHGGIDTSAGP